MGFGIFSNYKIDNFRFKSQTQTKVILDEIYARLMGKKLAKDFIIYYSNYDWYDQEIDVCMKYFPMRPNIPAITAKLVNDKMGQ